MNLTPDAGQSYRWYHAPLQHPALMPLALLALLSGTMLLALLIGQYPLGIQELLQLLLDHLGFSTLSSEDRATLDMLVWDIRLPRVLTAVLIGAALAASGAAFQAVFINPLVSPGILGVLAGASFGAALGLVLASHWGVVQFLAVAGGLLAVLTSVGISRLAGGQGTMMLVLGGIFSAALFAGLLALVKYSADPYEQLPSIVYWLMGSLGQASLDDLLLYAPVLLICIAGLSLLGRALDVMALGDEAAQALGVPVQKLRLLVILLATVASALTVALAGMIGWIGLLAPHIARLIVGPLNRILVPVSALTGALFLLCADMLARQITASELPIGVVTELVGLPVFLLVLHRASKGWSHR